MQNVFRVMAGVLLTIFLNSCDLIEHRKYHDPSLKLTSEDYQSLTKAPSVAETPPPFKPEPKRVPQKPILTRQMKTPVSLTLQDNAPLTDVLL